MKSVNIYINSNIYESVLTSLRQWLMLGKHTNYKTLKYNYTLNIFHNKKN